VSLVALGAADPAHDQHARLANLGQQRVIESRCDRRCREQREWARNDVSNIGVSFGDAQSRVSRDRNPRAGLAKSAEAIGREHRIPRLDAAQKYGIGSSNESRQKILRARDSHMVEEPRATRITKLREGEP
jgi:hypothetical protein